MAATTHVHYAEARGAEALMQLRAFLDSLTVCEDCLGAELLRSITQPGLYLVNSRWSGPVPALSLPEGVQGWAFKVLEER